MQAQQNNGGQPQQQAPQEQPFTVGTAIDMNQQLLEKQPTWEELKAKNGAPKSQGLMGPPQQPVQQQGPSQMDVDAIRAVREGRVDPRVVLQDPNVSSQAKMAIQGGLA